MFASGFVNRRAFFDFFRGKNGNLTNVKQRYNSVRIHQVIQNIKAFFI